METVIFQSAHPLVALRYKDGPPRGVSWGGMSFQPDERGVIMLPVEAVRELTESHGMEGVPEHIAAFVKDTVARAVAEIVQTTEGGAVRPAAFAPGGDHPEGGPQPALVPPPSEAEVLASASQSAAATTADKPTKATKAAN